MGSSGGSDGKESACNAKKTQVRSLGWEDSPGEGNGNHLQYSCLENPMDLRAWWAAVHGAAKSMGSQKAGRYLATNTSFHFQIDTNS